MTPAKRAVEASYAPEGLSRIEAARYVGVSATTFDLLVENREMPPARRFRSAKRFVWLKRELDLALGELPVDGGADEDEYAGVKL